MIKKAIVTGGAGFIGAHLTSELVKREIETHVIDNYAAGKIEGREVSGAVYHEVDVRDTEALKDIFKDSDVVFHLAALPRVQDSIDHPIETSSVNVDGTLSVLEAARIAGVGKVVLSSSAAVYGDQTTMPLSEDMAATPKSPYGLHKYIGEKMCVLWSDLYQLPTTSLRYFNVYGPGFDPNGPYALVVGRFIDLRLQNKPLTITGDGSNTRDYVHVKDVVLANLLAADSSKPTVGKVYNIGSGIETSVNELAIMIGGPTEHHDPRVEPRCSVADVLKAKTELGWEAKIDLDSGLQELKNLHRLT